jgi:DNA-binding IclR family transcriptional regulator
MGNGQMPEEAESAAGPLERYVSLLELIAAFPGELTSTGIAQALQLPKSTVHRLLRVLARSGLVEGGDHKERTLSLGARLTRLLHAAGQSDWIEAAVLPTLIQATSRLPDGSFYLAKLAGHRVFVVASAAGDPRWRSYVVPGQELPPHAAASAKVILAYQDAALIEAALDRPFEAFTRNTCTDPDMVRKDIIEAKALGYSKCIECIHEGMSALAVPIKIPVDGVIYSVGVTGPITRRIQEEPEGILAILSDMTKSLAPLLSLRAKGKHNPV